MTAVNINDLAAWCNIDTEYMDDIGMLYSSNPLAIAHNLYLNGEKITDLVIPDGITSINKYAFVGCSSLTSVSFPNSLTTIGNDAFADCTGLTSVSFPNSLTTIGAYSFYGCTGLTTLDIPNTIKSLYPYSFDGCPNLNTVNIHDLAAWCDISFMGRGANPLSYIHNLSLNGEPVTNLVIPDGVTSISAFAFSGCNNIKSVELPKSLTNIGMMAFEDCVSLPQITIPNNVTYIDNGAFARCEILTSVTFEDGETPLQTKNEIFNNVPLETVYLGRNASGSYPFEGTAGRPARVTIGNTVTELGDYLFAGWKNLVNVTWDFQCRVTSIGNGTFSGCTGLESLPIPQSVTSIGNSAFAGCTGCIGWIYIPDDCTSIGESAFNGCTGVELVHIPSSLTSIGNGAFYDCTGLTKVQIEDLTAWCNIDYQIVQQDGASQFSNPLSYAHNLYLNDEKITNLVIPDGITSIKRYVFGGCSGLTSVVIPNSVTSIERFAFGLCEGLTSVEIPNSVTSIGKYAFSYCTGLTSFTMGNSVKEIGEGTFNNCAGLTSITIPGSVTTIGIGAFRRCSGLTSVYSLNTTPPTVDSYCFDDEQCQKATLYVPRTAIDTYRTTDPWTNFLNIEGIDVSGIKDINADGNGKRSVYYDLNGRKLNEPKTGLNIVNGKKVIVK